MQTSKIKLSKEPGPMIMERDFPTLTISFGVAGLIGAMALWMNGFGVESLFVAISSLLVGITSKETTVDLLNNEITKNLKIAGIPFRTAFVKYKHAERLQIKKTRMRQQMHSRGSSTTITFYLYKGYLITEGQTHLLTKSKNREYVVKRMEKVSKELGVPLLVD